MAAVTLSNSEVEYIITAAGNVEKRLIPEYRQFGAPNVDILFVHMMEHIDEDVTGNPTSTSTATPLARSALSSFLNLGSVIKNRSS